MNVRKIIFNVRKIIFIVTVATFVALIAGCYFDKADSSKSVIDGEDINAYVSYAKARSVWDYPIKPGSDEWRVTSYDYKVEKSQPPKDLLGKWSTETLFNYCVDYPFNKVTLLFNNPNDGFKRAYEESEVWQEFIKRVDAVDIFVQYFEDRSYYKLFEMKDLEERNNELFTLFFLEKIVSETDFLVHIDDSNKRKLTATIFLSHQSKIDYPDEFIGFHYNSSLSALLKILESNQVEISTDVVSLQELRQKTNNGYFADFDVEPYIFERIVTYLNH